MPDKITVLQPNEPTPPVKVHDGWGKAKRKMDSAGAVLAELGRLYRKTAAGEMLPEDLTKGTYALEKMAKLAEQAVLERRISELEKKLNEALRDASK